MELLLTDDEVVAVALAESGRWPSGLPTVDVEQEPALLAAALRGRRSLAVRELIGSDAPTNELLTSVRRAAVSAETFLCLYVVDEAGTRASGGLNVNAFQSGEGWLVETVSDIGVHQFAVCSTDELRTLFEGLLQAAYGKGLAPTPTGASVLWLTLVTPTRRLSVSVRHQSIRRHAAAAGEDTGAAEPVSGDLGGEVERLLLLAARFGEPAGSTTLS